MEAALLEVAMRDRVTVVQLPVAVTFLPREGPVRQAQAMPGRAIARLMGTRFSCHPIGGRARRAVAMQALDTVEDDDLACGRLKFC